MLLVAWEHINPSPIGGSNEPCQARAAPRLPQNLSDSDGQSDLQIFCLQVLFSEVVGVVLREGRCHLNHVQK